MSVSNRFLPFLTLGLLVLAAPSAPSAAPIALTVTPAAGYAPLTVNLKVTIEPNYLNTGACLQWSSADAVVSSGTDLLAGGPVLAQNHL